MADSLIRISGIPPFDGEYPLDFNEVFTTREWRWFKQIGGYMPLTLDDGLKNGDPDVFISLAVIAMHRSGKIDRDEVLGVAERLADAPFEESRIALQFEEEEEANPPASTPEPDASSPSEISETASSSGNGLKIGLDRSDDAQSPIGTTR